MIIDFIIFENKINFGTKLEPIFMNKNKFEELEDRLRKAKCVEDVFGAKPPDRSEISKLLEDVKKFNRSTGNADLDQRSEILINNHIPFFCRWAGTQKMLKKYGAREEYPLAIQVGVKEHYKQRKFHLPGEKFVVHFDELHSVNFVGRWHNDKVIVRNGDEVVREGKVVHYGTHAASEFWKGLHPKEEYMCILTPEMFELGNTIEIQTWAHFSVGEFIAKAWR